MESRKRDLMREYPRAVMHMREQKKLGRFGLVFGAGISQHFGFPSWSELVTRIASNPRVRGDQILAGTGPKASVSQLLFQNYRAKALEMLPEGFDEYDRLSSFIQSGWHRIIHDALYRDVPSSVMDLQNAAPYLREFLDIIKEARLTVNYNFDDTLQRLLSERRSPHERQERRGFRTVWNADIQLYPQKGVIYHPNGYLPREFHERPSDDLIFLEDAFGDQLLDSVSGHYATLSYHFSQTTCLFVGLSLEDSTLKHLLRKNVTLHPGHVHYYVHFMQNGQVLDDESRLAMRDANFEVYNLETLFLDKEGIAALGWLVSASDDEVELIADEVGVPTAYRFFLTGSVAVGKSTAASQFRSLVTHDEWLAPKTPEMNRDPSKVADQEVIRWIDQWVAQQWRHKNFNLSRLATRGVHIIDRCPLDALAFTPEHEWNSKARFTRETITPDQSTTTLCKGEVILMIGNPEAMAVRAMKLQKDITPENLEHRQDLLRVIYDRGVPGIVELDTREKSIQRVAKEICWIIHLDRYEECDLQKRLEQVENGTVCPTPASNGQGEA